MKRGDMVADALRCIYTGEIPASTCRAIVEDTATGRRYTWPDGAAWRSVLPDEPIVPCETKAAKRETKIAERKTRTAQLSLF